MASLTPNRRRSDIHSVDFLLGDSQMGPVIRSFQWPETGLPPVTDWPQSLKLATQSMLQSAHPMFIAWGPDLIQLYNDALIPILGKRHLHAMGRPMRDTWREGWATMSADTERVMRDGKKASRENQILVTDRHGYAEECHMTYSFSPISGDDGKVGGFVATCTENTESIVLRRRIQLLRQLAEQLGNDNRSLEAVCALTTDILINNAHDIPFSLIYLVDKNMDKARLMGTTGLKEGHPACPLSIDLDAKAKQTAFWPLADVLEDRKPIGVSRLTERFGRLPGGPWPEPPKAAVIHPLFGSQSQVAGFFIYGLSPRLDYNDDYRGFLELVTQSIAHGICRSQSFEDDKEQRNKEAQLHQTSKLEAVGRLAGGVAHDFNNLITGIIGISEEIKSRFIDDPDTRQDVDQIIKASKRAFAVTKQLLAFARRQVVQPIVLDVNVTVMEVNRLLQQLLGEDIVIHLELSKVNRLKMDRGHFDQILLNLAVNARDAMPDGGKLTIRTANKDLKADEPKGQFDLPPGAYVMLEIEDDGSGMEPQEVAHLFEPFFTTKSREKGSGLGLPMVYGIVKQSGGDIAVATEPGKGTTFTILLPASFEIRSTRESVSPELPAAQSHETILVVEDEDIVRHVIVKKLKQQGYHVLEALNGKVACDIAQQHKARLDLVLTDVVMPEMNGRQVVDRIRESRPEVGALFMSGYPEDVIAHRGVLEPGIAFIEKSEANGTGLIEKVREVLDRARTNPKR